MAILWIASQIRDATDLVGSTGPIQSFGLIARRVIAFQPVSWSALKQVAHYRSHITHRIQLLLYAFQSGSFCPLHL
jgi:hypothetical protein